MRIREIDAGEKMGKEISRICGEGKALIKDSNLYFLPTSVVRGFEKMLEGKHPLFVTEAVMRICGVCHAAHAIASCEAFENALDIYPPGNGLMSREVIGLLNRIQSHLIHNLLILEDLLKKSIKDDVAILILDILEIVNEMLQELAGASTHPNKLIIGGIEKNWSEKIIEINGKRLKEAGKLYHELKKIELDEVLWTKKALESKEVEFDSNYLASHPFYGDISVIDIPKINVEPYSKIFGDESAKTSSSMVALYGEEPVEVGPRARLRTYRDFSDRSMIGLQIARFKEISSAFNRIDKIFQEINPTSPFKIEKFIFKKGYGVGVYEAPRGTLIHKVWLDKEGRVEKYNIIVPTMFNLPLINKINSEFGIRLLDPCIICASH